MGKYMYFLYLIAAIVMSVGVGAYALQDMEIRSHARHEVIRADASTRSAAAVARALDRFLRANPDLVPAIPAGAVSTRIPAGVLREVTGDRRGGLMLPSGLEFHVNRDGEILIVLTTDDPSASARFKGNLLDAFGRKLRFDDDGRGASIGLDPQAPVRDINEIVEENIDPPLPVPDPVLPIPPYVPPVIIHDPILPDEPDIPPPPPDDPTTPPPDPGEGDGSGDDETGDSQPGGDEGEEGGGDDSGNADPGNDGSDGGGGGDGGSGDEPRDRSALPPYPPNEEEFADLCSRLQATPDLVAFAVAEGMTPEDGAVFQDMADTARTHCTSVQEQRRIHPDNPRPINTGPDRMLDHLAIAAAAGMFEEDIELPNLEPGSPQEVLSASILVALMSTMPLDEPWAPSPEPEPDPVPEPGDEDHEGEPEEGNPDDDSRPDDEPANP